MTNENNVTPKNENNDMDIEEHKNEDFNDSDYMCESSESESEPDQDVEIFMPHQIEGDQEMEVDLSAYNLLHNFNTNWPCLSFSILEEELDNIRSFPMSCSLIGGTSAPNPNENELIVIKLKNLNRIEEADSDDEEESVQDPKKQPIFENFSIPHYGSINRIRTHFNASSGKYISAAWSEMGSVNLYNLSPLMPNFSKSLTKDQFKPFYNINHNIEGYALDFDNNGKNIATGCNKGLIIISDLNELKSIQKYCNPSFQSIEDIQWSPTENNIFITASSDKEIRVWDIRTNGKSMLSFKAHDSDVNVIDWNSKSSYLLASGSDSGEFGVWDLRSVSNTSVSPVASFNWHKKPITSINWSTFDDSVLAVASDDHSISIWDLAVEAEDNSSSELPSQLLFIHMGQKYPKEVKFHSQWNGVLLSTAQDGFNIFKPIST